MCIRDSINLALRYGGNVNQLDMISKYVEWITSLPWTKESLDNLDIQNAQKVMDANHFGLEDIKKRILEYISVLILQKKNAKPGMHFHAVSYTHLDVYKRQSLDSSILLKTSPESIPELYASIRTGSASA